MIAAAQLRGERPLLMETAEWECVVKASQVGGNPALLEEGRRQLLDQLTDGLAADPAGTASALLRLVEEETARLEELEVAHQEREAADRAELADLLAVDTTPEGEVVRRYQLDCDRKLHRAITSLLKLRRDEGVEVASDSDPDGALGPDAAGPVRTAIDGEDGPAAGPEPLSLPLDAAATDSPSDAIAAPSPHPCQPDRHPAPENEPTPPGAAHQITENEPTPPGAAHQVPENEPTPPAAGHQVRENEPGTSGPIAALSVPAMVLALMVLLAAGLFAAFAGPVGGPFGNPGAAQHGRSGPPAANVYSALPPPLEYPYQRQGLEFHPPGIDAPSTASG